MVLHNPLLYFHMYNLLIQCKYFRKCLKQLYIILPVGKQCMAWTKERGTGVCSLPAGAIIYTIDNLPTLETCIIRFELCFITGSLSSRVS